MGLKRRIVQRWIRKHLNNSDVSIRCKDIRTIGKTGKKDFKYKIHAKDCEMIFDNDTKVDIEDVVVYLDIDDIDILKSVVRDLSKGSILNMISKLF